MMFHSFFTSSYNSEDMPIKAVEDTNLMSTIMFIILARQHEKSALEETYGKEFHVFLLHLKMFFSSLDLSLESNGKLNNPGNRLGIDLEHEEKGSLTTHSNLICIQNIRAEFMNFVPTLFLERAFLCQCFFLPRKVWPPKILVRPGKQDVVPISESVNCQFQGNKNSFSEVRSATIHSAGSLVSVLPL